LALGYLIVPGGSYLQGHFLTDPQGRPIANDFVNVWTAGWLALDGTAPAAYDCTLHRAAEVRAVGYDFDGYYGWHYPPPAFFFAAALATLPYLVAAVVWLVTTLAAYAAAIAGILGLRTGVLFALGFPAAIWNITAGQNGFLTAALIGGTLGLLERHPALAGVCLGLLTYKPQFGLLFPIVLIADRRWLTIAVAALVAILLAALSWLAFGSASWQAFVHWAPLSSRVLIDEGALDWYRLQSVFALVRAHGGSDRWPGQFKAYYRCCSPSDWFGCGRAALPSSLRPRRLPPARCSRRLISSCTIWSCSPSRWRSCCDSP
jgi:arabinofuranan 3-O-arabinosyltransferase